MDLDQLKYFTEVVRSGTYAAAAERLAVSQPALWKRVKALESQLGVPLFERVGRRVRPTSSGRQLAEAAETALASAVDVSRLASALREGKVGIVRLVCAPPHLKRLAPALAQFAREQPGIELEIREQGIIEPSLLIDSGTADVVTALRTQDPIDGFPVYRVTVGVIQPEPGDGTKRLYLPVEELAEMGLVTAPPGYYSRTQLDLACARAGFVPKVLMESSNTAALVAFARAGMGVAVVADDTLSGSERESFRALTVRGGPLIGEVWCYSKPGYPPAERLAETITSSIN